MASGTALSRQPIVISGGRSTSHASLFISNSNSIQLHSASINSYFRNVNARHYIIKLALIDSGRSSRSRTERCAFFIRCRFRRMCFGMALPIRVLRHRNSVILKNTCGRLDEMQERKTKCWSRYNSSEIDALCGRWCGILLQQGKPSFEIMCLKNTLYLFKLIFDTKMVLKNII